MTNTERKRNGKHPTYKASFLLPPSSVINRPLLYPFDDCNWPRLVAIFHGRRTSSTSFLSRCNNKQWVNNISRIKGGSHRCTSVFGDAFHFEQKRETVKWSTVCLSLSPSLTLSSLLRAVWKLNVKQSGTGERGERETYGGAISWRGIDFYQDRGGERTLG